MKEKLFTIFSALLLLCASGCTQPRAEKAEEKSPETPAAAPVQVSLENTDAAEPAVAAAPDGALYVVWVEHRAEGMSDVFLRKTNADNTLNAPVRVNSDTGKATAWRGDPPTVAVAADGAVYVGWTARASGKGHDADLYLSTSRDGGKTFEPAVKVNDDQKPARQGMHSLAVGKDGRVYLVWLDERNLSPAAPMQKHRGEAMEKESNNEVFTAYSEDGGRTISKNQMIARDACPCCKTSATTGPDGRVYLGWRQVLKGDYRHIAVSTSADKGKTFSTPVIVSDDQWFIAACPVSGPSLSATGEGVLKVLWYTEGEAGAQGLYLTQSLDGGQTFSARQLISKGNVRGNPQLVADAGIKKGAAIWQNVESNASGLLRADISADGAVNGSAALASGGELPSAAISGSELYTAYISSNGKQRSIWLKRFGKL